MSALFGFPVICASVSGSIPSYQFSASPLDFSWANDAEGWAALAILTILEVVLGIDNIIFQSIAIERLPDHLQTRARRLGLFSAMCMRLLLLLGIAWILSWQRDLFGISGHHFSGKDCLVIIGGIFLILQSTREIHHKLEGAADQINRGGFPKKPVRFIAVMIQITLMDIVFSLDSVITAVGSAKWVSVMMLAVMLAVGMMFFFAPLIAAFVKKHPTIKVLALSFLILIGTALIGEGFHAEIPKGYIYFSMAFSFLVEMVNLRVRRKESEKAITNVEGET